MGSWYNADGLYIKFDTTEGEAGKIGEYGFLTEGNVHVLEIRALDLTTLTDSTQTILDQNAWLPKNARPEWVDVICTEAVTGSNAVLDLGLRKLNQSGTEFDYDGLLADAPRTDWATVGNIKRYSIGVTGAGAKLGTVLAETGYLVATYDTAAFTDGTVNIRIGFSFP